MEENNLIPREKLKNYFETGKYPTEGQFSDLIDSLRHKEDILTTKEMAILANSLAIIDSVFIYYYINDVGDVQLPIVVSSQDEEDQEIIVKNTKGNVIKQFLIGSAPYTITSKKSSGGDLKGTEYYILGYQLSASYTIYRMFGNNLGPFPEGFVFGELEDVKLPIQIYKFNYGMTLNVISTSIKFINKTEIPIKYRINAGNWSDRFRTEDTVTSHYDAWDYLSFIYKADLRGINESIKCEIYNADNGNLLTTGYLNAGQSQDAWSGGERIDGVRSVRIECSYVKNEK